MKKTIFLLIILLQFIGNAAEAQQYRFDYYPEADLYYDVRDKKFIYNDNGTWIRAVAVPSSIPRLGQRVIVRSNTKDIWYENHIHKAKYVRGVYDPLWTLPQETLPIPVGYLPAVGECRYWFPDKTLDEQPTEGGDCDALRTSASTGAWLLSRPNRTKVVVEKYSSRTGGMVREIRHYKVRG